MSRKFIAYLDSGANVHSTYIVKVDLDDLQLTDEEFDAMFDDEKDEMFKEIAWGNMDWGWYEV